MKSFRLPVLYVVSLLTLSAGAAQYRIDLSPPAGEAINPTNYANGDHAVGLSALNAVGQPASSATGGEIGDGLRYDDVTNTLTLNIGYGSDFGFTDLAGNFSVAHVHGPVAVQFPASNTGAGVAFGLVHTPGSSALTGSFTGTAVLDATQESQLLANQLYINIHSSFAAGGELRAQLVPVAQLLHHWPLDGDLLDAVGSADGTMVGVQSNVTGRVDGGLELDNSNYVELGTGVMPTTAYTKAAWVKIGRTTSSNNILSGTNGHAFYAPNGRLSGGHNGAWNAVQDSETLPLNTWVHVAITYDPSVDGGTLRLYRNGIPVPGSNGVATNIGPHSDTSAHIGAFNNTSRWLGCLDDVALWGTALDEAAIRQLAYAGVNSVNHGAAHGFTHDVFTQVSGISDFEVAYEIHLPDEMALGNGTIAPYDIDHASRWPRWTYDRVAYYLALQAGPADPLEWVYVSMDDFANGRTEHLGIPSVASGGFFQTEVSNMRVEASGGSSVTTGNGIATGNIEFWGTNYGTAQGVGYPGGSGSQYDFDDTPVASGNYGSMQVHNHDLDGDGAGTAGESILAYSGWGQGSADCIGIGSQPANHPDWTFAGNAPSKSVKHLVVLVRPTNPPAMTWVARPENLQFVPRNLNTNQGALFFAGSVDEPGYDSLVVKLDREGVALPEIVQPLAYSGNSAGFDIATNIVAELAEYNVDVCVRNGGGDTLVWRAQQLVAGDAFLVNGQSNAEARSFNGSANGNQSPFIRSFGTRVFNTSVNTDLAWHLAEGDAITGPGAVGQWPLRMARQLMDQTGIPIALINHARGGQPISYFQRNDADPANIGNNYGRLLFRAQEAGVANAVRSILWHQGEAEGGAGQIHEEGFIALYEDWLTDYPGVERVYVHQLREGCGVAAFDVDLRDRQRRLADTFPGISALSTTGINTHDGCHFPYVDGYERLGDQNAAILRRDLYAGPDSPNIDPPNPQYVWLSTPNRQEIRIALREPSADLIFDDGTEAFFRIDGSTATVTNGYIDAGTIVLELDAPADDGITLTYAGHSGAGPWVTNVTGVGLFTFIEPLYSSLGPVPAPSNLVATAFSGCIVDLNWDSDPTIDQFLVRRNNTVIGSTLSRVFRDDGVIPGQLYTYEVASVNPTYTSAWSQVATVVPGEFNLLSRVPEAIDYDLVYALKIENNSLLGTTEVPDYLVDNSATFTQTFDRVAYYMELQTTPADPLEWVYVSVDAFTINAAQLGVPTIAAGAIFQQILTNMNVLASAGSGVTPGTGLATGNIEFWGNNYAQGNSEGIPGASEDAYDFGDIRSEAGTYGSMQIHNHGAGETLFAYNHWGAAGIDDLGIGTNPGVQPDWTFEGNAPGYAVKRLLVLARVPDLDMDGLATRWETEHGLDPNEDGTDDINNGPDGDPDEDGWTNREEQDADTDPRDSASAPQAIIVYQDADHPLIDIPTSPERTYQLFWKDAADAAGAWTAVGPAQPGNGTPLTLPDPSASTETRRVYRVEIRLP